MSEKSSLRICTWNAWIALSPYGCGWLGPVVMPHLETRRDSQLRQRRQLDALKRLHVSDSDIFCLQEVNPVKRRGPGLARELEMRGITQRCNAGIKYGSWGLPLHLDDGLLTLIGKKNGKDFRKRKIRRISLSGRAREWRPPLGPSLFAQLGEHRGALLVETCFQGRKIVVVNLHLHHGPEKIPSNAMRRKRELARLAGILKRHAKNADLLVVCGDFNCDADSGALAPLLKLGLVDAAKLSGSAQKPTWLPERNFLTRISAALALKHRSTRANLRAGRRGWEDKPHVFDRIYLRSKRPLKKVKLKRVLDEPMLSDHYGVLAEIAF
jgi:endonuclease/exonuclease/phosphatase family metal-dependent hydrolase